MTKTTIYNQKIFHPLAITVALMLVFLLGNALGIGSISTAQEAATTTDKVQIPEPATGTQEEVDSKTSIFCETKLTEYADAEFTKYSEYMETNFKNKSTTSSLMDNGMKRYDQFKNDIRAQLQLLTEGQLTYASSSNSSTSAQFSRLSSCEALANTYLDNAAKMLQMRAITTSGIKKASIFVEKYQQINSKLRELDVGIMKMVANFSSFQQKLPCYVKTCA